ncbi:unnamed protein product [Camellia sinensis]
MERSKKIISGKVWGVIVLVGLISVMAQQAKALGVREAYGCWGGCYNECILQSGMANSERLPCYLKCLGSCISLPLSVSASSDKTGYQYYCQLGCSMDQCIRFSSGMGEKWKGAWRTAPPKSAISRMFRSLLHLHACTLVFASMQSIVIPNLFLHC